MGRFGWLQRVKQLWTLSKINSNLETAHTLPYTKSDIERKEIKTTNANFDTKKSELCISYVFQIKVQAKLSCRQVSVGKNR